MVSTRIKFIIVGFILFLGSAYLAKKLHLQNYFKGKYEIEELQKIKSFDNPSFVEMPSFLYIAHAGGGYNNATYLNTFEAIKRSYALGVNFIEADINYTLDSTIVLSHDFVPTNASVFFQDKTSGTHISLRDLLDWLSHSNVFLITDIKTNNLKILHQIVRDYPTLKDKIIPQAYFIKEINPIMTMGYKKVIFTNYLAGYPVNVLKSLGNTHLLYAITIPYDLNFKIMRYSGLFKKIRTPILTHTINDLTLTKNLSSSGCRGIYTDFLLFPSLIRN